MCNRTWIARRNPPEPIPYIGPFHLLANQHEDSGSQPYPGFIKLQRGMPLCVLEIGLDYLVPGWTVEARLTDRRWV
jgi:hypothetical protein